MNLKKKFDDANGKYRKHDYFLTIFEILLSF